MIGVAEASGALNLLDKGGMLLRRLLGRPRIAILPFDREENLKIWTFADPPVHQKKFWTLEVRVKGSSTAKRCIAFAHVHQIAPVVAPRGSFALHWADIEYKFRTTGADPADIGPEGRRLDVAFSFPGQPAPGVWVATTGAVTAPHLRGEDLLPPGDYVVRVVVRSENAGADGVTLNMRVTSTWDGLEVWCGDN